MAHQAPGRKLFVGSLPHQCSDDLLRTEFSRFGIVEDIFVKPNCDLGRQWAFVTMSTCEAANAAKDACDRLLQFPGTDKPCDVMIAKPANERAQAPGGAPAVSYGAPAAFGGATYGAPAPQMSSMSPQASRKIHVGSLPVTITNEDLGGEFSKYGQVTDIFISNKPCDPGRQWAFVTFAEPFQAQAAKDKCDRVLMFPGSDRAAEVTLARNQGMFGQESIVQSAPAPGFGQAPGGGMGGGPKKIFVGSLPDQVSKEQLQAEFSKYGQVTDVHINYKASDQPNRNWAFVTFATPEQANFAKESTDRILVVPPSDKACEVMLAKNQGMRGQDPINAGPQQHHAPPQQQYAPQYGVPQGATFGGAGQPPPPTAPPPASLTPWRMYKTAAGLPYYHNHQTNQTVWECPPDLQVPGQGSYGAAPQRPQQQHFAPY